MRDPESDFLASERQHEQPSAHRKGRLSRIVAIAMAILIFAAGIGTDRYVFNSGPRATASSSLTSQKAFTTLEQTWDLIHSEYVDPSAINDTQLIYGAASGMVDALGDTGHSRFLDPTEAKQFDEETAGSYVGIGVEIDTSGSLPVIIAPFDDSPADKAGIRAGDVILAVNGQDVTGMPFEQLSVLLRGKPGTQVTVELRHENESTPYTVKLTRANIVIKPVSWTMLPDKIAFVRLSQFSEGATDEMRAALKTIKARGAKGIILDLRDNPGGLVTEAIGVSSLFMPDGTVIYQQESRDSKPQPVTTKGQPLAPDLPMVVLVNDGSASAAEIVGGALRDNHRADLMGETTFGTGTVLTSHPLPDGSNLLLGTALWLTANGQQIWKKGVKPDQTIALPLGVRPVRPKDEAKATFASLKAGKDTQLFAAFARLTGIPGPRSTPTASPVATP